MMEFNKIKVAIYCATIFGGGATVAVKNQQANLCQATDCKVFSFREYNLFNKIIFSINRIVDRFVHIVFFSKNPIFHSSNFISGCVPETLNVFNPDIVFVHWVSNGAISRKIIDKMPGKKILVLHDSWWNCGFEHHPRLGIRSMRKFDQFILKRKVRMLGQFDYIIAPSMWQLHSFLSVYPDFTSKSHVIRNFFPIFDVRASCYTDLFNICCVGHNLLDDYHKGAEGVRALIDFVDRNNISCKITIIGRVKKQILKEFSCYSFLDFVGPLSNVEVLEQFSKADIFCNFSELENYSYVNIEAQLCGAFLLTWNVGGNAETIVDKSCGLVLPFNDQGALFCSLIEIMNDLDNFRSTRISRIELAARSFNNQDVLFQHLELIDELLT